MGNNGKDKVGGNEGGKAKQGSSRKRGMCGKNWGRVIQQEGNFLKYEGKGAVTDILGLGMELDDRRMGMELDNPE